MTEHFAPVYHSRIILTKVPPIDFLKDVYLCFSTRQTDIFITDLFVIVIREIYVHVYTRMLIY